MTTGHRLPTSKGQRLLMMPSFVLVNTAVVASLLLPHYDVCAQAQTTVRDTVAVMRAVVDHLRPDFPRDSLVFDPTPARGKTAARLD